MKKWMLVFFSLSVRMAFGQSIAFSFDDPHTRSTPLYTAAQRNQMLLQTLEKHHLQAALFVCGHRVNDSSGLALLNTWDQKSHLMANHSWSHFYFPAKNCSLQKFRADFLRNDSLIRTFKNYTKLFRFPYLKEGDTEEKRDGMRKTLDSMDYKNGYVSIDASDWYIDGELIKALQQGLTQKDLEPYRNFYLDHIYERALYYDSLAHLLWGRKIKHVLLLHHNLLNALFLNDLIEYFKAKGWTLINASEAYTDEVYNIQPGILPAGESIVWAVAKSEASGKYEKQLRYPAEDGAYEKEKLEVYLERYKIKKR